MKENSIKNEQSSIKEAVKTMEHWIEYEKNNKEKIKRADELINIQETILSDYKRILKENEELNEKILDNAGIYQLGFKDGEKSYIKKVKDKIKEEKMPLTIVGGIRNKKILKYGVSLGRMQVVQELIEEREEK